LVRDGTVDGGVVEKPVSVTSTVIFEALLALLVLDESAGTVM